MTSALFGGDHLARSDGSDVGDDCPLGANLLVVGADTDGMAVLDEDFGDGGVGGDRAAVGFDPATSVSTS